MASRDTGCLGSILGFWGGLFVICVLIGMMWGGPWAIYRSMRHPHLVNAGPGTVEAPYQTCHGSGQDQSCTDNVKLNIPSQHRTLTLEDKKGLYQLAETGPLPVREVVYDTANREVYELMYYGGGSYMVESGSQYYLVMGIVFCSIDVLVIAYLAWRFLPRGGRAKAAAAPV